MGTAVLLDCSGSDRDFGSNGGTSPGGAADAGEPPIAAGNGPTSGGAGGSEAGASGEPTASGGETSGGGSAGAAGAAQQEPTPPPGAFAWYKADEEDVTTLNVTLMDGDDFVKSSWVKTGLTAAALQPDAQGGITATVLYGRAAASTRTLQHATSGFPHSYSAKTIRVRAKAGAYRYLRVGGRGVAPNGDASATFDLINGVVNNGNARSATITPLEGLWYSCEATVLSGPDIWVQVTSDEGQPATTEPLMWLQAAEVDQRVVTGWEDRVGNRDLKGGAGGWRWISAAPQFGGLPALESYATYNTKMVAGEASDWAFLHDGSGSTLVSLRLQSLFSSKYVNSLQTVVDDAHEGARLGTSANDEKRWSYSVTNAAGLRLFSIEGGSTTGPKWIAGSYGAGHTPQAQLFEQGNLVASGNSSTEPSQSAGNLSLTLGGAYTPTQLVREIIVYNRVLESTEIAQLRAYFAPQLGE